ncbi:uncharacterized protein LOC128957108 [Oppia nitens]|uniref:uncharacterized protein LOC128957108 n=1 Tax=Oppia nitens TaxID=1686743 RepID=UPI0023DA9784|nr:uncharacterized protein LOC128957108 [Oppia nitens]
MVLMKSCCCFKTIRNGSFASAIYTMILYVIVMTACTFHMHAVYEDIEMLSFTLLMICLAIIMVITSILLLIGLCADNGQLYVPWMVSIILTITMDPFKAVIFVIDFIICGINVSDT